MPYFAVDDRAYSHRKFVKLGAARMAATGLWTTAGSWSSAHLTDGFIPDYVVEQWDPGLELAKRLVAAGLWTDGEEDDAGDTGYRFHEWADRNGTRESIQGKRADDAERKRRSRERQVRRSDGTYGPHDDGPGGGQPDALFEVIGESDRSPADVTPDVTRDTDRTHGGFHEESHRSHPTPPHTHPNPTDKDSSAAPRRTRSRVEYSPEFEAFWSAYHPDRREGKGDAAKAFTKACRGAPLREGESRATTLTARVAVWVTHWQAIGTEPGFVPHASTWLNGKRYDDPPPRAPGSRLAVRNTQANGGLGEGTTAERVSAVLALKGRGAPTTEGRTG